MQHETLIERAVQIPVGNVTLDGDLTLPEGAHGIVLFAHGSGSSRHSPRNRYVGGDDDVVIQLNRQAIAQMRCERQLQIVEGATHLFQEPGTLEEVARLARMWFAEHLTAAT